MSLNARARSCALGPLLFGLLALSGAQAREPGSTAPAVVLAPGYSALNYPAPVAGTYRLPPIEMAADAPYLDSHGQRGTLHALYDGHVTLLSFIYTQCDDVNGCPLATFVMSQLAKRLAADPRIGRKLRLISFSFDPLHDTPAVLEQYAQPFRPVGANWEFVTAPEPAALAPTLTAYQQSMQQTGGRAFAHILRVFLIRSEERRVGKECRL